MIIDTQRDSSLRSVINSIQARASNGCFATTVSPSVYFLSHRYFGTQFLIIDLVIAYSRNDTEKDVDYDY